MSSEVLAIYLQFIVKLSRVSFPLLYPSFPLFVYFPTRFFHSWHLYYLYTCLPFSPHCYTIFSSHLHYFYPLVHAFTHCYIILHYSIFFRYYTKLNFSTALHCLFSILHHFPILPSYSHSYFPSIGLLASQYYTTFSTILHHFSL